MPGIPRESLWQNGGVPDLLSQAASVLARESLKLPTAMAGLPSTSAVTAPGAPAPAAPPDLGELAGRVCPVTGAALPLPNADRADLARQAHEVLASLFETVGRSTGARGLPRPPTGLPGAAGPVPGLDQDRLRKQLHEFVETLLVTFSEATGDKGLPAEDQVPLLRCHAPVQAGANARATVRVANEEGSPSQVTLYCSNFVADRGCEIPSLRVSISPRTATIPPGGETTFELTIAVPHQTQAGTYSGLIQAMGSKYVKAVLSVDVL